jgi:hypothetical protein
VVGDAEPEREPALQHGLDRQRLLRQRDRVAGLDRHDGGADLDPARLEPDEQRGGEGVELVGDLRHPDAREPGVLGPPRVGAEPFHLRRVATPFGADHQSDAHDAASPVPSENVPLPGV